MADYQLTDTDTVLRNADRMFIPSDPANRDHAEFLAWQAEGNEPDAYVPPAPPPVTTVTPRQARLVLLGAGLLDQVETMVEQAGGATKITWEYATEINRQDPLITGIGGALGLTEGQIDALFTNAANL